MNTSKRTILLIDDEPLILDLFAYVLRETGYRVKTALSALEGLKLLENHRFDGIVSDVQLGSLNGFDVAEIARKKQPEMPLVLITGHPSEADAQRAQSLGYTYLQKPMDMPHFIAQINRALEGDKAVSTARESFGR